MNYTNGIPALITKALKVGTLPLVFKKTKLGWAAFVPAKLNPDGSVAEVSRVALCDWGHQQGLRSLRFDVARRYLAQVYPDSMVCYVDLRWALKLPNWVGQYGAMHELAMAMKRAGLIS